MIVPPESVQVQVDPEWFGTLAEAPDAPTGTEMGAEIAGSAGTALTVTVAEDVLVDGQPLAAVTVSV